MPAISENADTSFDLLQNLCNGVPCDTISSDPFYYLRRVRAADKTTTEDPWFNVTMYLIYTGGSCLICAVYCGFIIYMMRK